MREPRHHVVVAPGSPDLDEQRVERGAELDIAALGEIVVEFIEQRVVVDERARERRRRGARAARGHDLRARDDFEQIVLGQDRKVLDVVPEAVGVGEDARARGDAELVARAVLRDIAARLQVHDGVALVNRRRVAIARAVRNRETH